GNRGPRARQLAPLVGPAADSEGAGERRCPSAMAPGFPDARLLGSRTGGGGRGPCDTMRAISSASNSPAAGAAFDGRAAASAAASAAAMASAPAARPEAPGDAGIGAA